MVSINENKSYFECKWYALNLNEPVPVYITHSNGGHDRQ